MKAIYRTIPAFQLKNGHVLQQWSSQQSKLVHHEIPSVDTVARTYTRRALNGKHAGKVTTWPLVAEYTVYDRFELVLMGYVQDSDFETTAPEMAEGERVVKDAHN